MPISANDYPAWQGRRVLVTGHTGFKGSWLALWLRQLGAEVAGLALPAPTEPSLFDRVRLQELVDHVEGDIRDPATVDAVVARVQPEVIFHLAAQPIVRTSYLQPVETYATNVMGTVHVLDAARRLGNVRAIVCVTTDKCYENREWVWPYREDDPMGGFDPYSSSKGAAELIIAAYRRSFFPGKDMAAGGTGLASVRAGNVIGGGDWALDRLLPDLVRAFERGVAPIVRNPGSVRPWQHVLEALGGYLMIAERLLVGDATVSEAWNFGPSEEDAQSVAWMVERMGALWGNVPPPVVEPSTSALHEAHLLRLDCSKARSLLGWRPRLRLEEALAWIVDWHRRVGAGEGARETTLRQITLYQNREC